MIPPCSAALPKLCPSVCILLCSNSRLQFPTCDGKDTNSTGRRNKELLEENALLAELSEVKHVLY